MTAEEIYKLCKPLWTKHIETKPEGVRFSSGHAAFYTDQLGEMMLLTDPVAALACEAAITRWLLAKSDGLEISDICAVGKAFLVVRCHDIIEDTSDGQSLLEALIAAAMQVPKDASADAPR